MRGRSTGLPQRHPQLQDYGSRGEAQHLTPGSVKMGGKRGHPWSGKQVTPSENVVLERDMPALGLSSCWHAWAMVLMDLPVLPPPTAAVWGCPRHPGQDGASCVEHSLTGDLGKQCSCREQGRGAQGRLADRVGLPAV